MILTLILIEWANILFPVRWFTAIPWAGSKLGIFRVFEVDKVVVTASSKCFNSGFIDKRDKGIDLVNLAGLLEPPLLPE